MKSLTSLNIKYLRTQSQLTQDGFAQAVGANRANIESYERDIAKPKADIANNICNLFGITLDDLYNKDLSKTMVEVKTDASNEISLGIKLEPRKRKAEAGAFSENDFDEIVARHQARFLNSGLSKTERLAYRHIYTQTAPDDLMIYVLSEIDKRYGK